MLCYLLGLVAIRKTLLKTRVLDFIPSGSPNMTFRHQKVEAFFELTMPMLFKARGTRYGHKA